MGSGSLRSPEPGFTGWVGTWPAVKPALRLARASLGLDCLRRMLLRATTRPGQACALVERRGRMQVLVGVGKPPAIRVGSSHDSEATGDVMIAVQQPQQFVGDLRT